jgi:hypothetical protein
MIQDLQRRDIFDLSHKDMQTYVIIKQELAVKVVSSSTDLKYSTPIERQVFQHRNVHFLETCSAFSALAVAELIRMTHVQTHRRVGRREIILFFPAEP